MFALVRFRSLIRYRLSPSYKKSDSKDVFSITKQFVAFAFIFMAIYVGINAKPKRRQTKNLSPNDFYVLYYVDLIFLKLESYTNCNGRRGSRPSRDAMMIYLNVTDLCTKTTMFYVPNILW